MKIGFYATIAKNNIKKNYRFFIPHILTGAGLMACFYILLTLALDERLTKVRGGNYLPTFMGMGTAVMAILSVILILYTNSFLMKQRKREFGLYNILGMEKRHVAKVIFYEILISSIASIVLGLIGGVLFYKLCTLLICKLLNVDIIIGFYFIKAKTLIPSTIFFLILDLFTYFYNRISISLMKPVELLKSKNTGEKEPKVKWFILVIGLITLGLGYYIALTTESPLEAIYLFFVAVILVIIGTYCLFVAGSIFVLKLLKKNEKYYYNKKHMTAVSGLIYRMKQNAVGLASIAILATGVLVMISTTVSLYSGLQETLNSNYPQHLYFSAGYEESDGKLVQLPQDTLTDIVEKAAKEQGLDIASIETQKYLEVAYLCKNGVLISYADDVSEVEYSDLTSFTFISQQEYEYLTGADLELGTNEIAVCSFSTNVNNHVTGIDSLTIHDKNYRIAKTLTFFPIESRMNHTINCYGVVVADDDVLDEIYQSQKKAYGNHASEYTNQLAVTFTDVNKALRVGEGVHDTIFRSITSIADKQKGAEKKWRMNFDAIWDGREILYGMYGTLLFLGILLGLVCLFATALIIYYKQISEGYEDRNRYQIMQKIGMSTDEVKNTIRGQILMVFFLPLLVAGVHVIFAFPILEKLLHVMLLSSTWLFVGCSIIVYIVFAIVYVIIYMGTAKTYYHIVH